MHNKRSLSYLVLLPFLVIASLQGARAEEAAGSVDELVEQGKYTQAIEKAKEELANAEKKFGGEHVQVGAAVMKLAGLYGYKGLDKEGVPLYQRAQKIFEKSKDEENFYLCLSNLGMTYFELEQYDEAEACYRKALDIAKRSKQSDRIDANSTEEILKRVKEEKDNKAEAAKAPPILINGKKVTARLNSTTYIASDIAKAEQDWIKKGARKEHEEKGLVVMMRYFGANFGILSLEASKKFMAGSSFADGTILYMFNVNTLEEKVRLIKELGLQKKVAIKDIQQREHELFEVSPNQFISFATKSEYYMCGQPDCPNFTKHQPAEGLCPSCKKRLVHTSSWE